MRQSPTQTVLFVSGLLTLWQFADPRGAEGLLAIHGVSRGELPLHLHDHPEHVVVRLAVEPTLNLTDRLLVY